MTQNIVQNQIGKGKPKRVEWVDIGKFICIMFVMLSHLESGTDGLRAFYTPFFLTVFFFLSGYVYREPATFKELFLKKVKGLFVPWLVFSHFNIFLSQIISLKEHRSLLVALKWNWLQIRGLDDGMWFVAALFVAFIPFYFLIRQKKPRAMITVSIVLSVVSVIYTRIADPELFPWQRPALPWHLEYVFQAVLWMVLGFYFKEFGEKFFDRYDSVISCVALWAVYLLLVFGFDGSYSNWIMIPLDYLKSVLGIAAVIALCKHVKSNPYFLFVGSNTLTYFGLHGKVYAVLEKLMAVFAGGFYQTILANNVASNLFAMMMTVVLSVLLIIPAMIINRFFPWVLGRKKSK